MVRARKFKRKTSEYLASCSLERSSLRSLIYGELLFHPWDVEKKAWSQRPQVAFADAVMVGLSNHLKESGVLANRKDQIITHTKQLFENNPSGTFTGQKNTKKDVQQRRAVRRNAHSSAVIAHMFSSFTNRLRAEVDTIKLVLDAHDTLRALVYPREPSEVPPAAPRAGEAAPPTDLEKHLDTIRSSGLSKPSWQVYDHCAAFTRLYAVYEQFVEDLASDYLRVMPDLYKQYADLPVNVRKQHRIGIGQILMKLGKDGPYKSLDEGSVVKGWSEGLAGNPRYTLLPDAFLIDPQNYRAEILAGLFRYLGIEDCWAWIEKHPMVLEFMAHERDVNKRRGNYFTTLSKQK